MVTERTDTEIAGVRLTDLTMHTDARGVFTELFRESWGLGVLPVQWNVVRSEPGVLRGVHVHPVHDDYLTIIDGSATIGLRDLRRGSPTEGKVERVEVSGDALRSIAIPHGVAHGFLFQEPSMHVYAVSRYWDTEDELACLWSDSDLEMHWPTQPRLVSERDGSAQSFSSLLSEIEPFQAIWQEELRRAL